DVLGGPIYPWFAVEPDPVLVDVFPALKRGFCGLDHGSVERELRASEYVCGANIGFRKGIFESLRFNPHLGRSGGGLIAGEENDVIDKIRTQGGRIFWCPSMRVKHWVDSSRMTLPYLTAYYAGLGRTHIRETGIPAGPQLCGVP